MTISSMHRVAVLCLFGLALLFVAPFSASAKVGQVCGGWEGPACDVGEFCSHKPGTCLYFVGPLSRGTCVRVPKGRCPKFGRPVCGCDGVTYPNDCVRIQAGVSPSHIGACN